MIYFSTLLNQIDSILQHLEQNQVDFTVFRVKMIIRPPAKIPPSILPKSSKTTVLSVLLIVSELSEIIES